MVGYTDEKWIGRCSARNRYGWIAYCCGNEGIVEHDLDRTIDNLCAIASKSMQHIDRQVIEIIVSKPCP